MYGVCFFFFFTSRIHPSGRKVGHPKICFQFRIFFPLSFFCVSFFFPLVFFFAQLLLSQRINHRNCAVWQFKDLSGFSCPQLLYLRFGCLIFFFTFFQSLARNYLRWLWTLRDINHGKCDKVDDFLIPCRCPLPINVLGVYMYMAPLCCGAARAKISKR